MSLANEDVTAALDRLAGLCAAATPGPWEVAGGRHLSYASGAGEDVMAVRVNHHAGPWERIYVKRDVDGADAALIVAAVNALPRLLAAIRAAYGLAETYTRHPQSPEDRERNRYGAAMEDCSNNLRAALDEALGVPGA